MVLLLLRLVQSTATFACLVTDRLPRRTLVIGIYTSCEEANAIYLSVKSDLMQYCHKNNFLK